MPSADLDLPRSQASHTPTPSPISTEATGWRRTKPPAPSPIGGAAAFSVSREAASSAAAIKASAIRPPVV
jgi:hypothetical protein